MSVDRSFWWEFPEGADGYQWTKCKLQGGLAPQECLVARQGAKFGRYDVLAGIGPLALYREFAGVEASPEGILGFANQYGRLEAAAAEPLKLWQLQIHWMRELVEIWDLVKKSAAKALYEKFTWEDGWPRYATPRVILALENGISHPSMFSEEDWATIQGQRLREPDLGGGDPRYRPGGNPTFTPNDAVMASWLLVIQKVTAGMYGRVNQVLFWDSKRRKTDMETRPTNLLGALWLQFGLSIRFEKDARRCLECSRWFEVSPGTSRSDRELCSDSCKSKSYRSRKKRALQLHAKGQGLSAIAKKLGSDLNTVKGWINTHRR
jgi:hypothetical protein